MDFSREIPLQPELLQYHRLIRYCSSFPIPFKGKLESSSVLGGHQVFVCFHPHCCHNKFLLQAVPMLPSVETTRTGWHRPLPDRKVEGLMLGLFQSELLVNTHVLRYFPQSMCSQPGWPIQTG